MEALKAAEAVGGVETDFFSVKGKKMGFCIQCDRCMKEESLDCVRQQDDLTGFPERFLGYDGYIVGTPVYDMNITAQLQTVINRLRAYWSVLKKDPEYFYYKCGGAVAVGGVRNGGEETALECINNFFFALGIAPVSAGCQAYNGASLWSKNLLGAEGAEQDPVGLASVRALGRRVGLTTKALAAGKPPKE